MTFKAEIDALLKKIWAAAIVLMLCLVIASFSSRAQAAEPEQIWELELVLVLPGGEEVLGRTFPGYAPRPVGNVVACTDVHRKATNETKGKKTMYRGIPTEHYWVCRPAGSEHVKRSP